MLSMCAFEIIRSRRDESICVHWLRSNHSDLNYPRSFILIGPLQARSKRSISGLRTFWAKLQSAALITHLVERANVEVESYAIYLWVTRNRDVRNIFYFGSVSVRFLKKNSDSVRNEFYSVRLKTQICSNTLCLGNATPRVPGYPKTRVTRQFSNP